ncbi:MAG: hypothetical protein PHU49_06580 [Syntrophorhabdaceae bacterium]|nr:hypothetical protein [Syntrophorhabdaceae bacterium]MDD5243666.1 hypothetical protein [Syntrophorhabdaceae bacterium]
MKKEDPAYSAQKIMMRFAALTGLVPAEQPPRRYLWTDAYAVCNFLGLYLETKDIKYKDLALQLIDQVHNKLGRYREGDPRTGWISGLSDQEGKEHPTAGGLRIGKTMNERGPDEPMDECLEWSRDGQYYHYLAKWMHALNRATAVTGDFTYNRWAMELAKAAHARFVYTVPGTDLRQMYWKMSTDLSYPLVPSMGHHDPLDGLVTYIQLQGTAEKDPERPQSPDLIEEIGDIATICEGRDWQTDDLLGLGGLLSDAFRVAQLFVKGVLEGSGLLRVILDASLPGLKYPGRENFLHAPARYRLAFRELGLSIGLHALKKLDALIGEDQDLFRDDRDIAVFLKTHWKYMSIGEKIEAFWLDGQHQASPAWNEHRDINMVMLATSLAPDGFLTLFPTP